MEDILNWQTETVVVIYEAILIRETIEKIELQRLHMIAASFSNPTWNEKGNDHNKYIQELNQGFDNAIDYVRNPKEKEIDWTKPWYAAAKRGLEKTRQKYAWATEGKSMREVMSPEQVEARKRSRKEIDQVN